MSESIFNAAARLQGQLELEIITELKAQLATQAQALKDAEITTKMLVLANADRDSLQSKLKDAEALCQWTTKALVEAQADRNKLCRAIDPMSETKCSERSTESLRDWAACNRAERDSLRSQRADSVKVICEQSNIINSLRSQLEAAQQKLDKLVHPTQEKKRTDSVSAEDAG